VQKPSASIDELLACPTPAGWLDAAVRHTDTLLLDHANCEKKAAATAMSLLFQYGGERPELQVELSRLAREELRHFEQVLRLMHRRGIPQRPLSPARYAAGLRRHLSKREPDKFTDLLLIGAFIEARSCERFRSLVPILDPELGQFYASLMAAESRHFQLYIGLAEKYGAGDTGARLEVFAAAEAELISSADDDFRFHSGAPTESLGGS